CGFPEFIARSSRADTTTRGVIRAKSAARCVDNNGLHFLTFLTKRAGGDGGKSRGPQQGAVYAPRFPSTHIREERGEAPVTRVGACMASWCTAVERGWSIEICARWGASRNEIRFCQKRGTGRASLAMAGLYLSGRVLAVRMRRGDGSRHAAS